MRIRGFLRTQRQKTTFPYSAEFSDNRIIDSVRQIISETKSWKECTVSKWQSDFPFVWLRNTSKNRTFSKTYLSCCKGHNFIKNADTPFVALCPRFFFKWYLLLHLSVSWCGFQCTKNVVYLFCGVIFTVIKCILWKQNTLHRFEFESSLWLPPLCGVRYSFSFCFQHFISYTPDISKHCHYNINTCYSAEILRKSRVNY